MQEPRLEPGFLQVFRIYAWLRLATLGFTILAGLRVRREVGELDLLFPFAFTAGTTVLLLGLLYWPWFQRRSGRFYIPVLLVIATSTVVIEQNYFVFHRSFIQTNPLIYILPILVAWQYSFPQVLIFTLGVGLAEIGFTILLQQPIRVMKSVPPFLHGAEYALVYLAVYSRLVSFLVLGYVVTRLVKAQRQQRQALAEANQKLVRHAATLEQLTIGRERIRLSRELHDTLAHTLSALAVQIEAVFAVWENIPDKALAMLEQMMETTRSGLNETRRALSALRASPLEEIGLALALRTLAEDFAARNELTLALDVPDNLDDLPPEVEQCYYRVAQEAFENIARHADASQLSVQMKQDSRSLRLTIVDDGRGFNPGKTPDIPQLGIQGMRERAELIDANLEVVSQPATGTTIHLELEMGI